MNYIVIGAGFGDEGKGHTVAQIIETSPLPISFVVRFNGGHQAGHTVEHNGVRHVFSNFGAGSLHGLPTYWSKYCTIHPTGIRNEFEILEKKGITPRLYIDPLCPVTTPYEITHNQETTKHGTVGIGFGSTIQREEDHYSLVAQDIKAGTWLHKIAMMELHYYEYLADIQSFADDLYWLLDNPNIKIERPHLRNNNIFEGAQGLLLDQDIGFFPHVTRSKCTPRNAIQIIKDFGIDPAADITYVTRAYSTRHGAGPFPAADFNSYLELRPDIIETNQTNQYQGEFRKSILDLDLMRYAIDRSNLECQGFKASRSLEITCLNHHQEDYFWMLRKGVPFKGTTRDIRY